MGELERQIPAEIPNIVSGEIVRTDDTAGMARYLQDIREHEKQLRTLKSMISDVIIDVARQSGTKTLHFGGMDVKITGGPKPAWDLEKLNELLDAGLPYERFNELVKQTVSYDVNAAVARSIASSNPRYAEIIEAARSEEPAPERVVVSGG